MNTQPPQKTCYDTPRETKALQGSRPVNPQNIIPPKPSSGAQPPAHATTNGKAAK